MKALRQVARSMRALGRELARGSGLGAPQTPALGLALGGGFARGIAHIGVLKVLEEAQIPVSFMAGTSVGALIGAAYCGGLTAAELEQIAFQVRSHHIARWTLSKLGLATNQRMAVFLHRILKQKTFEDLKIPLAIAATDFTSGEGVAFRSGPLIDAVRASCAYPGIFLPVEINGRLLVDGMLAYPVPSVPLREMGARRVLSINLKGGLSRTGPRHVFDVIGQSFSIALEQSAKVWRRASDLVVEPDVTGFEYDDFARAGEMIHAGEVAMRQALPQVQAWFAGERPTRRAAVSTGVVGVVSEAEAS
jgi:NTE family protein